MKREELVENMAGAYAKAENSHWDSHWVAAKGISAALDVAVGELLCDPTGEESQAALKEQAEFERTMTERHKYTFTHSVAMRIIASRRSQLEKVKTPEERVKLSIQPSGVWSVNLDGKSYCTQMNSELAEIFRLGLIQQLKEGAK